MRPSINSDYFQKYCEIASQLLSRPDKENTIIKSIIRYVVRGAVNHATELPGHDNKLGARYISKKAHDQIKKGNRNELIGEHIVPISVVNKLLLELDCPSESEVGNLIKKFSCRAVITTDEDKILKEKKFAKNMPPNWNRVSTMDRYEQSGIEIVNMTFKAALKAPTPLSNEDGT